MRRLFFSLTMTAIMTGCTLFSGVEELELKDPNPPATGTGTGSEQQRADAGKSSSQPLPDFPEFGSSSKDAGSSSSKPVVPIEDTGKQCGAQGSWTKCQVVATALSCAEQCKAMGHTCVDSCCVQDSTTRTYAAKVGMTYATAGLTCDTATIPSTSAAGLCSDPILPLTTDIRCCCR